MTTLVEDRVQTAVRYALVRSRTLRTKRPEALFLLLVVPVSVRIVQRTYHGPGSEKKRIVLRTIRRLVEERFFHADGLTDDEVRDRLRDLCLKTHVVHAAVEMCVQCANGRIDVGKHPKHDDCCCTIS